MFSIWDLGLGELRIGSTDLGKGVDFDISRSIRKKIPIFHDLIVPLKIRSGKIGFFFHEKWHLHRCKTSWKVDGSIYNPFELKNS